MTRKYKDTLRDALLAAYKATLGSGSKASIYTGAEPADESATETGTLLWEGTATGEWLAAPASGAMVMVAPFTGGTLADGTAGYYRLRTSDGTAMEQGAITRAFSLVTSVSTASGNNVLTFAAAGTVSDGMAVAGTGIPPGTTVLSHTSTTVTLSNVSTGVSSGATVYFGDTSGEMWLPQTVFAPSLSFTIDVFTRVAPGA